MNQNEIISWKNKIQEILGFEIGVSTEAIRDLLILYVLLEANAQKAALRSVRTEISNHNIFAEAMDRITINQAEAMKFIKTL